MKKLFTTFVDSLTASLEAFAVQQRDFAQKYEEQQYWRGYFDCLEGLQHEKCVCGRKKIW